MFDFNSDQVFSSMRQVMTASGALLLAVLPADLTNLAIGIVPIVVSVLWSLWRNTDNISDMIFSGTRQVLLAVGAFAVGKGWISNDMLQWIAGTGFAAISSMLSMWFYRNAPGPLLPGTTIVDEPQ